MTARQAGGAEVSHFHERSGHWSLNRHVDGSVVVALCARLLGAMPWFCVHSLAAAAIHWHPIAAGHLAGVDYGILDDDVPHLHRRLGADDTDMDAPFMPPGMYPRGQEGEDEVRPEAGWGKERRERGREENQLCCGAWNAPSTAEAGLQPGAAFAGWRPCKGTAA